MLNLSICQFSSPLVYVWQDLWEKFFGGIVFLFMKRPAYSHCHSINYLSESLPNYLDFCGNFRVLKINDLEGVIMRILLKNCIVDEVRLLSSKHQFSPTTTTLYRKRASRKSCVGNGLAD